MSHSITPHEEKPLKCYGIKQKKKEIRNIIYMGVNIDLNHAGLPWTNPQKITVKADEYISDMTINRRIIKFIK